MLKGKNGISIHSSAASIFFMSDKFFFSYGDLSLSCKRLLFLLVMYHSHYLEIFNRTQITVFHLMMPSFRVVIQYSIKDTEVNVYIPVHSNSAL